MQTGEWESERAARGTEREREGDRERDRERERRERERVGREKARKKERKREKKERERERTSKLHYQGECERVWREKGERRSRRMKQWTESEKAVRKPSVVEHNSSLRYDGVHGDRPSGTSGDAITVWFVSVPQLSVTSHDMWGRLLGYILFNHHCEVECWIQASALDVMWI